MPSRLWTTSQYSPARGLHEEAQSHVCSAGLQNRAAPWEPGWATDMLGRLSLEPPELLVSLLRTRAVQLACRPLTASSPLLPGALILRPGGGVSGQRCPLWAQTLLRHMGQLVDHLLSSDTLPPLGPGPHAITELPSRRWKFSRLLPQPRPLTRSSPMGDPHNRPPWETPRWLSGRAPSSPGPHPPGEGPNLVSSGCFTRLLAGQLGGRWDFESKLHPLQAV